MDELFPLLMFIIFILAPIIEGLRAKNKKQPPPPHQRRMPPRTGPQHRLPQQPRSGVEEVTTKAPADENAATMVPDDLWEILTGQKRMPGPVQTPPQPTSRRRPDWDVVYDPDLEEEEEESRAETLPVEDTRAEDVNVEVRRSRVEAQSLETISRHEEPIIISLEENLPTAAQRHAAFHQKIAAPVPVVSRPAKRQRLLDMNNRSELQRAFLLVEVLGKPKGLE